MSARRGAPNAFQRNVLTCSHRCRHGDGRDWAQRGIDRPRRVGHAGTARRGVAITLHCLQVTAVGGHVAVRHRVIRGHRERFRALLDPGDHLRRVEIAVDAGHQGGDAGDDRGRKTRAQIGIHLIRVGVAGWDCRPAVDRGVDGEQARLTRARIDTVSAGRAHRHLRAEAAEAHLRADIAQPSHAGNPDAIGWRIDGSTLIASGHDDDHALGDQFVDDHLFGSRTRARAAQTHVDDVRGVQVIGGVSDMQSCGPSHAVEDVGVEAAALA